jgi:23S rRNA (cytidine1920-2'-O)/16S rRNA (cytidine1409-2'-O)-methyltransferase
MKKMRIDLLLVEKGLVDSLSQAQRLVMAGKVRVDDQVVPNPAVSFFENVSIKIEQGPRYVSRGGDKLAAALLEFNIDVSRMICADVGASTGGFTDCLLQHGCKRVYAIDVGRGILHWKIRQNPNVVVMEGVNARFLERLPENIDFVTIDASFISSKVILPIVKGWFQESTGQVIVLIKPQFEADRSQTSRGKGVIREPKVHKQVLYTVLEFAESEGYQISDLMRSPLLGPKGNVEFLARLSLQGQTKVDLKGMIESLFNPENIGGESV